MCEELAKSEISSNHLKQENNRLLKQLSFQEKCLQLFENYRKCLNNFNNNCKCDENIENKVLFNTLEDEYESVFLNEIHKRNEQIDENIQINENLPINKTKLSLKNKFSKIIDKNKNLNTNWNNEESIETTDDINESEKEFVFGNTLVNKRKRVLHSELIIKKSREIDDKNNETKSMLKNNSKSEPKTESKRGETYVSTKRPIKCEECGKQYVVEKHLRKHIDKQHSVEVIFKCNDCDHTFRRKDAMNRHKIAKHSTEERVKYSCDYPKCEFTGYNLKTHIKSVHLDCNQRLKCETCGKIFHKKISLKIHKKYSHSSIKYKCDFDTECSFETTNFQYIKEHKLRHLGEKKFMCEWNECQKWFLTKQELRVHVNRVHKNIRLHRCVWPGCESTFKCDAELRKHLNTHSDDRKFKCKYKGCDRVYKHSAALYSHTRGHEGRYNVCDWPECDKKFLGARELRIHVMAHRGDKPFKCDFPDCKWSFTANNFLTRHKKTHKLIQI